jgi:hypothetical protein
VWAVGDPALRHDLGLALAEQAAAPLLDLA